MTPAHRLPGHKGAPQSKVKRSNLADDDDSSSVSSTSSSSSSSSSSRQNPVEANTHNHRTKKHDYDEKGDDSDSDSSVGTDVSYHSNLSTQSYRLRKSRAPQHRSPGKLNKSVSTPVLKVTTTNGSIRQLNSSSRKGSSSFVNAPASSLNVPTVPTTPPASSPSSPALSPLRALPALLNQIGASPSYPKISSAKSTPLPPPPEISEEEFFDPDNPDLTKRWNELVASTPTTAATTARTSLAFPNFGNFHDPRARERLSDGRTVHAIGLTGIKYVAAASQQDEVELDDLLEAMRVMSLTLIHHAQELAREEKVLRDDGPEVLALYKDIVSPHHHYSQEHIRTIKTVIDLDNLNTRRLSTASATKGFVVDPAGAKSRRSSSSSTGSAKAAAAAAAASVSAQLAANQHRRRGSAQSLDHGSPKTSPATAPTSKTKESKKEGKDKKVKKQTSKKSFGFLGFRSSGSEKEKEKEKEKKTEKTFEERFEKTMHKLRQPWFTDPVRDEPDPTIATLPDATSQDAASSDQQKPASTASASSSSSASASRQAPRVSPSASPIPAPAQLPAGSSARHSFQIDNSAAASMLLPSSSAAVRFPQNPRPQSFHEASAAGMGLGLGVGGMVGAPQQMYPLLGNVPKQKNPSMTPVPGTLLATTAPVGSMAGAGVMPGMQGIHGMQQQYQLQQQQQFAASYAAVGM
ncbi:hypothetical protein HK102_004319, partial [Quaeritorhiza haematococci]